MGQPPIASAILVPTAAAIAAPGEPALQRLRQQFWHGRSLRAQLIITFVVIDLVATLIAGGVTILKARTDTRVEISASMRLAKLLVNESFSLRRQEAPGRQLLADLPLRLRSLRHVRMTVRDAAGLPISGTSAGDAAARGDEREQPPWWFAALIAPPPIIDEVRVTIGGTPIGSILLEGVPSDEIAEVWESTVVHGLVAGALNLGIIGLLYLLFGRVLGPLEGLARGLADLEGRNYRVRQPRPRVRELAAIADRFNALAEALEATRQENRQLSRRLITAQDDERRHTALELHDEVGPCLFGLKAHAASIATAAGQGQDQIAHQVRERVRDLVGIVDHLQAINRSLLNRLRPMALGHVPLQDLLAEIVRDRAHQHPGIAITLDTGRLERSYGDSIDLTIYRCIQESLTNAVRHAQATRIDVEIGEAAGQGDGNEASPQIALAVRDNGRGIAPGARRGFGLLGMQERVQALGGDYAVVAGDGGGTRVTVSMPVRLKPATREAATTAGMP